MTEEIRKKKVCVCIPCYGTMTAKWLIGFIKFLSDTAEYDLHLIVHEEQPVSKSRNFFGESILSKNPDYVFFLDSDNILPPGGLRRLIKTMDDKGADLVTAMYFAKDAPHYPVVRQYHSGGFWIVENAPLGEVFEIAGCGFGCCLVKPQVFKDVQPPWFVFSHEKWGTRDILLSEDLYFCRSLMRAGKKMMCDATVISSHIGSTVDVAEFLCYAPLRQATFEDRNEVMLDLCAFAGLSSEEANMNMMSGPELLRKEWNSLDPKTDAEILSFYKDTKNYLYDLINWHFAARRQFDMDFVENLTELWKRKETEFFSKGPPKILDVGCGVGQNAIMLARRGFDVTLADVGGHTLDFAKYRFDQHKVPYKLWVMDEQERPPEEYYDFILAFDVLEHLSEKQLEQCVDRICKVKIPRTIVYTTPSFGKSEAHPMHFDKTEEYEKLVDKLLNSHAPKTGQNGIQKDHE